MQCVILKTFSYYVYSVYMSKKRYVMPLFKFIKQEIQVKIGVKHAKFSLIKML